MLFMQMVATQTIWHAASKAHTNRKLRHDIVQTTNVPFGVASIGTDDWSPVNALRMSAGKATYAAQLIIQLHFGVLSSLLLGASAAFASNILT